MESQTAPNRITDPPYDSGHRGSGTRSRRHECCPACDVLRDVRFYRIGKTKYIKDVESLFLRVQAKGEQGRVEVRQENQNVPRKNNEAQVAQLPGVTTSLLK